MSWDEFNNKMNNIFGKSFIVVDELYFNIEKEIIDYINLLYSKFNNFEIEYNEVKEYLKKL